MPRPALDVLRSLDAYTRASDMPPPAALIGDWWDAQAVIAPSIDIVADCGPPDSGDGYWFGHIGFPRYADDPVADGLPEMAGGLTSTILVLRERRWTMLGPDGSTVARNDWPSWIRRTIDDDADTSTISGRNWSADWTPPERAPHLAAITSCLEAIAAGEVYQACVCTRFTGVVDGSALEFYRSLTAKTMPAKSAFLQGDWGSVASFSPETFLRRKHGHVHSCPIKGTAAAGTDPDALARSTKDVAENVMIVDLVRNDLGRVAELGTVRVPELLSVAPAPGVWHLVSTVSAAVSAEISTAALLEAAFPPASVTGTPKIRALELLADWEPGSRGVYCGAIGMRGPADELDLSVAIRTVAIAPDGRAVLGVGGGITVDSDPEREWQECLDKAASIVEHHPPG